MIPRSNSFIYAMSDPRTGYVRYIGKTKSGWSRPSGHTHPKRLEKDHTYKGNWLRELLRAGHAPELDVLEYVAETDLNEAERRWIADGRSKGWPLTNLTDGGDAGGQPGQRSPEAKARMAIAAKKKYTKEYKASDAHREHVARLHAGRRGSSNSAEHNARISECSKGRRMSSEQKARLSAVCSKPVIDTTAGIEYPSCKAAAKALGVHPSLISLAVRGKYPHAAGHKFCRKEVV